MWYKHFDAFKKGKKTIVTVFCLVSYAMSKIPDGEIWLSQLV